MNNRELPDLQNPLEWNLVRRESLVATLEGKLFFIPPKNYVINSYVCAVGVRNPLAPGSWNLAGWANQRLLFNPSPGTSQFPSAVDTGGHRLSLNVLNLLVFPNYFKPWLLELKFARWHARIELEVWRYDGRDISLAERLGGGSSEPQ